MSTLFKTDPGHIYDFASKRPADIFNEAVLPTVNSFVDLLGQDPGGLEEAAQQREQQLQQDVSKDLFAKNQREDFLGQLRSNAPVDLGEYADEGTDYNAPLQQHAIRGEVDKGVVEEKPHVSVAKNLTDFVKEFEGFSAKPFSDYKQTSIGYGTRAKKGERVISKEEAERRLAQELGGARAEVEALNAQHKYNFTPNEMDALTSFAYNVGSLDQLTAGGKRSKEVIAQKILEYNKAGGKVLPGLKRRRQAEYSLFTKGY